MTGWNALAELCESEARRFEAASKDVASAQSNFLLELIRRNAGSAFGREHGFARMTSVDAYRSTMPINDFDVFIPWIERAADGESTCLSSDPLVAFEETSGTRSARKLIPITTAALAGFQAAVLPWLHDLLANRPGISAGKAYFSISPATRAQRHLTCGLPIGLPDAAYFGADSIPAFLSIMAVPPELAAIESVESWRLATLSALLAEESLSLISVWSPTFLTALAESFLATPDPVLATLASGRRRKIEKALAARIPFVEIWPRLDTISAWDSASSRIFIPALKRLFPQAHLQGKGLLATEGAMTLPLSAAPYPVLAARSGFFEFEGETGTLSLAHEVVEGDTYGIILTVASGLYRYRIGDLVTCRGFFRSLPMLEFVGRAGMGSDMIGEKLSEAAVAVALADLGRFSCLVARNTHPPRYLLIIEAASGDLIALAARIEARLHENPHYAHASRIGQLAPLLAVPIGEAYDHFVAHALANGCRLADIKPMPLCPDWHRATAIWPDLLTFDAETSPLAAAPQ